MQIDVAFVGNTTKLIKDLEQGFSKLNLSSNLTKQIEADLGKGFKDTLVIWIKWPKAWVKKV